jgi:hypothetical protein
MKGSYRSVTQELCNNTHAFYKIPLRTTNVVDIDMLAIHEPNAPFLSQDISSE